MILDRAYPGTDTDIVVVCSDLTATSMDRMMISGSLGGVMMSTLPGMQEVCVRILLKV